MRVRSLVHLSPRALLDRLAEIIAREREITAEMILVLAEVLRRRLHVAEGYPSLNAYCVGALGMSEDAAGKRIRVVRMARRFPQILSMVADGRLHLSAVCLLAPHMTHENAADLLAASTHRSKRQIEAMLAERFPQADVPAQVRALAPASEPTPGKSDGSRPSPRQGDSTGDRASCDVADFNVAGTDMATGEAGPSDEKSVPGRILVADVADAPAHPTPTREPFPREAPIAPQRCAVQFTMDQAMHEDLSRAQALLGHCVAPGELTEVFRRALRELVVKLEKQKFAATNRPRAAKPAAPALQPGTRGREPRASRRIPAAVRREVWARDHGRCTFVGTTGHRCESHNALEFDHIVPLAKGGASTAANLRLLCRAHNQHEAEQAYGEGYMHEIRERARRSAAR